MAPEQETRNTLSERIEKQLIVDEPDASALVEALEGAIEITNGRWKIRLCDRIEEREPKDQVFTYLLAKYAAARVSDVDVCMLVKRRELYEHFGREIVKEVCEHGWVRHWDGYVQIRPSFYKHTADELASRYGQRQSQTET